MYVGAKNGRRNTERDSGGTILALAPWDASGSRRSIASVIDKIALRLREKRLQTDP